MTLEAYKKKMERLGISRGHLADGQRIPSDPCNTSAHCRPEPKSSGINWSIPIRVPVPPELLAIDWSHLNPSQRGKNGGRKATA